MSFYNYSKAMELAKEADDYFTEGGVSEEAIAKSQELLDIHFSKQCFDFYKNYGYTQFYGYEFFGTDPDDTSGILEWNAVLYALDERNRYGLPKKWIPLLNYEDGTLAYFDYSCLNDEGEPRIILAGDNENGYHVLDVLADDFGSFLLDLITNVPE